MYRSIAAVSVILVIGGCGSSSSNTPTPTAIMPSVVGSVEQLADGSFIVMTDQETVTLPATTFTSNGQPAWIGGTTVGGTYQSANVLAVGGALDGTPFAGITGDLVAPPIGDAVYEGRVVFASASEFNDLPLALTYSVADGSVDALETEYTIVGTTSGNDLTGTVTFRGDEADFKGGFFGTNEVAGAFVGDAFGGIFYGVDAP